MADSIVIPAPPLVIPMITFLWSSSISSSSFSTCNAMSVSLVVITVATFVESFSATCPISVNANTKSAGIALLGWRRRATFAMWCARSPMRSRSALMRSAVINARRSEATGCCRAMMSMMRASNSCW